MEGQMAKESVNTYSLEQARADAQQAGRDTAKGADGTMALGIVALRATNAKLFEASAPKKNAPAGTPDPVRELYVDYLSEANKSTYGSKVNPADKKAVASGVAKLRVFAKFGTVKGSSKVKADLLRTVVDVMNRADPEAKRITSRYEGSVRVLRVAIKAGTASLNRKQVEEALAPAEKDASPDPVRDELEKLIARIEKIRDAVSTDKVHYFERILGEANHQLGAYDVAFPVAGGESSDDEDEDEGDEDFSLDPSKGTVELLEAAE